MKPSHIEHIGIAVRSLDDAIPLFAKILGTGCYAVEEVRDQHVKTAFFKVGETKIELLESTAPDGPIANFIEKKGEGIHHIALAVGGVVSYLNALQDASIQVIDKEPRKGAEGLDIAFLHPKSAHGVLFELCGKR
jgi:methylmalonyl-CoA/ethylmalonyl-CoA epimerase